MQIWLGEQLVSSDLHLKRQAMAILLVDAIIFFIILPFIVIKLMPDNRKNFINVEDKKQNYTIAMPCGVYRVRYWKCIPHNLKLSQMQSVLWK